MPSRLAISPFGGGSGAVFGGLGRKSGRGSNAGQLGRLSSQGGGNPLLPQGEWTSLLQGLQGGQDPGQITTDLLANWSSKHKYMPEQMGRMAPFIAGGLTGGDAYKHLQDFRNIDQSMQAYGAGAGQIATGATRASRGAAGQLARSGLGRSSATASLAGDFAQQAGSAQAGLFTNLFQQRQRNVANDASRAFEMNRMVTQLVMGGSPMGQIDQPRQSMTPQIIQAAGGIGAALPMLMMCWVAREVVPERWTSARAAILEAAPEDFIEFYLEHGEAIADYIHDKPESKARLKPLFERLADIGDSLGKAA